MNGIVREVTIGDCRLIQGDCLEVMPGLGSVDMVCTDPPYRVFSGGNKSNPALSKSLGGNDGRIFKHNDISFSDWMPLVFQKLKPDSHAYIMTNVKNLFEIQACALISGFKVHNLLVWEKQNANPNRWYMKNCEYTLFLRKGAAFPIKNMGSKTVHKFQNPIGCKLHPTEKPLDLMKLYIENSSSPGDTVLDPFFGSGTTGVAAANTGRKFIGIEHDPGYFDVAVKRIREAVEQASAPVQGGMGF
jgi:site-specific DNA-methyltransferase (adenine-specific)